MDRIVKLLAWSFVLGLTAKLLGWADGYHVIWGGALLAVLGVAAVLWRRWRSAGEEFSPEDEGVPPSRLRSALLGVVTGAVCVLCLYGEFLLLERVPWVYEGYYDRDRARLEGQMKTLEDAGNFEEAARLARARLGERLTPRWEKDLAATFYRDLVEAGRRCPGAEQSIGHFTEARAVAQRHGLDDRLATTLLEQAAQHADFTRRIAELRAEKKWPEAANDLRAALKERPPAERERTLAEGLYQALVEWGKGSPSLEEKGARFREASEVAGKYGLSDDAAAALRKSAEEELTRGADFEHRVARLKGEGRWSELAALLRLAAETSPRPEWVHPLDRWLCEALYRGGDGARNLPEKRRLYREALDVAQQFDLDAEPAASRLRAVEQELTRREALERRVTALRERAAYAELVALLRVSMEAQPRPEWPHPFDRWLSEALLRWGDTLDDLDAKREKYRAAVEADVEYRLDSTVAASRLTAVEEKLKERRRLEEERNRPADLPRGARAGFVRVSPDNYPPILVADVWVEDASGTPIHDLGEKDFRASFDGKPVKGVLVAPVRQEVTPLHVVLAIDISGPMGGEPLEAAKKGGKAFLIGLKEPKVSVEVLSFNDRVRRPCDWTEDLERAATRLDPLRAGGETALYQAAATALDDLRGRKGQKRLVLLTDGKDTAGGATLDGIIARCKDERVTVHAIGLRTEDLDPDTLKRLTKETGGEYVEASRQEEIVEHFRLTSRRIRRDFYRLVITPVGTVSPLPEKIPLQVKVRGGNGIDLSPAAPRP